MTDQAEQIAFGVPDERLRLHLPVPAEHAFGVGEDVVWLGHDFHPGMLEVLDLLVQPVDPQVEQRGRGRLLEQQPGAAEIDEHHGAEPGDQRQPERLGVASGGPVQVLGVLPHLNHQRTRAAHRAALPGRLASAPAAGIATARRRLDRRASRNSPSRASPKPTGASIAPRFSQSGRSWAPAANMAKMTTAATSPSAKTSTPTRTRTGEPPGGLDMGPG